MAIAIDSALSRYMIAVQRHPRLSREEETQLWRRWHEDLDARASDTLVRANLRYVVAIALKYRRYEMPIAELIAEGNCGIVHALAKFEPERGNRFVTYAAYWIRAFILNYIVRSWSLVGGGSGALHSRMFFKLRREKVRIANLVAERDVAEEMLAERLNISRIQLVEMIGQLEARDVSLQSRVFDGGAMNLGDTLMSTDSNQEEVLARSQHRRRLNQFAHTALDVLDSRERYIIEHRLMADSEVEQSLAEIGRCLGISRERVRQLELRAMGKLKHRIVELSGSRSLEELSAEIAA